LSAAEILALYNNESVDTTGLIAYYPFSNQTLPDFSIPKPCAPETRGTIYYDESDDAVYACKAAGWVEI
jgi:hypothetical protein